MAASIQLNGEIANWNRVPHSAVSTHSPHPLHLTITITLARTVTISLNPPQTSRNRDTKKIIGPMTLYKGKKFAPTISIVNPGRLC
jgi:hypothetical protein